MFISTQCLDLNLIALIMSVMLNVHLQSLYLTTRMKFRRHGCTNKAVVWNCGVVCSVQLLGGCFHQESDHSTFYHLAVIVQNHVIFKNLD